MQGCKTLFQHSPTNCEFRRLGTGCHFVAIATKEKSKLACDFLPNICLGFVRSGKNVCLWSFHIIMLWGFRGKKEKGSQAYANRHDSEMTWNRVLGQTD